MQVTEGVDATYGRVRETMFSTARRSGRKRLPRAIKGECGQCIRIRAFALLGSTNWRDEYMCSWHLPDVSSMLFPVVAGDHIIRPYSLHTALGQSLMYNTSLPAVSTSVLTTGINKQVLKRLVSSGKGRSSGSATREKPMINDCYEDHFLLPGGRVLMVTNKRVALIDAQGRQPINNMGS